MTKKESQDDRHSGQHLATDVDDNQVKSLTRNLMSTHFVTCKSQAGTAIGLSLCRMKIDVKSRNEGSLFGNLTSPTL